MPCARSPSSRATLRAAQEVAPAGVSIEIFDIGALPLYNEDLRHDGSFPDVVATLREKVRAAMRALPSRDRKIIFMYYYEEATMRQIGDALGVNESRVSQLHARAIRRLREALEAMMPRHEAAQALAFRLEQEVERDDRARLVRAFELVLARVPTEAETGSLLILENEGNARLCTSLPRVHVAVLGIEKLLPRTADLDVFLKLLPRSGTGQDLTTYQSLLTGPKSDPSREGPEQIHIVLLMLTLMSALNQKLEPIPAKILHSVSVGVA